MPAVGNPTNDSHTRSAAVALSQRELDGGTGVLEAQGDLDLSSAPKLKWALADLLEGGHANVVIDLSGVGFIDSTALGVLVGAQRNRGGTRMALVCANADVLKIFELTGLDGTFEIFSTFEEALTHMRGSAAASG